MLLYLYSGVTVRVRVLRTDLSIRATSENDWMLLKRVRLPWHQDPPTALGASYKLPLTMTVTNGNRASSTETEFWLASEAGRPVG